MKRVLENPDKIRNDFCIHPGRLFGCAFTVITCLLLCITYMVLKNWLGVLVTAVIAALFIWQGFIYGPWLSITPDGIRKHIFGWTLKTVSWNDVKEVGVVGTKVFNKHNPEKTGTLYIYFSPRTMTEEERFQLALDFPPKDMLFLEYEKGREDLVQILWNRKMVGFNIGKLRL